jgi:hypothetical protein
LEEAANSRPMRRPMREKKEKGLPIKRTDHVLVLDEDLLLEFDFMGEKEKPFLGSNYFS